MAAATSAIADPAQPQGPLHAYRRLLRSGEINRDPSQELAVEKLQSLHRALKGYQPSTGRSGLMARLGLGGLGGRGGAEPPQGLYMFGSVGRGKSMLMDLFFDSAPVERKRRVHFHAFMQDVHDWLHRWRLAQSGGEIDRSQVVARSRKRSDPMPELAEEIADQTWLLCFDEFHVTNITDAMILSRLFESLFEAGVVVVSTSNWPPDDLYKDGLQRDRFLPFIDLIKQRLDILMLEGATDHRLQRLKGVTVYYSPLGDKADKEMAHAFRRMTDGQTGKPDTVAQKGREIPVPSAAMGVAWFSFDGLCRQALGAGDYIAIAQKYHTALLSDVPRLTPQQRNEARRFMTLIDALYEHKVTLVCSAEAPPHALYPAGEGAFEFERTVSRLCEMQAEDYLSQPHVGAAVQAPPTEAAAE